MPLVTILILHEIFIFILAKCECELLSAILLPFVSSLSASCGTFFLLALDAGVMDDSVV